jgi:hypothetical protein
MVVIKIMSVVAVITVAKVLYKHSLNSLANTWKDSVPPCKF